MLTNVNKLNLIVKYDLFNVKCIWDNIKTYTKKVKDFFEALISMLSLKSLFACSFKYL